MGIIHTACRYLCTYVCCTCMFFTSKDLFNKEFCNSFTLLISEHIKQMFCILAAVPDRGELIHLDYDDITEQSDKIPLAPASQMSYLLVHHDELL